MGAPNRSASCVALVILCMGGIALGGHASAAAEADSDADRTEAQESSDQLETALATAERPETGVQRVPAQMVVLQGQDLRDQGRISVQQMLEDVPNLTYGLLAFQQSPDNSNQNTLHLHPAAP